MILVYHAKGRLPFLHFTIPRAACFNWTCSWYGLKPGSTAVALSGQLETFKQRMTKVWLTLFSHCSQFFGSWLNSSLSGFKQCCQGLTCVIHANHCKDYHHMSKVSTPWACQVHSQQNEYSNILGTIVWATLRLVRSVRGHSVFEIFLQVLSNATPWKTH